jgi:hypothetical protein
MILVGLKICQPNSPVIFPFDGVALNTLYRYRKHLDFGPPTKSIDFQIFGIKNYNGGGVYDQSIYERLSYSPYTISLYSAVLRV